jgi:hypothetical protein
MELALNLVWALLTVVFVRFWWLDAPRNGASKRAQAVALLVLIVIFFPVISVTDDLGAIQNPAVLDWCARRNHAAACPHAILPAVATLPPPVFAGLSFVFSRLAAPSRVSAPLVKIPALASIQNRPPPAA